MAKKKSHKFRFATVAARPAWHSLIPPTPMGGALFDTDPDELLIDPDFDELALDDLDHRATSGRIHTPEPLQ